MSQGDANDAVGDWGCLRALERVNSPFFRALAGCSILVACTIGVPQCVKMHRRMSSVGVSFWTLALTNVGGFLCVLNMYIFHYDQFALIPSAFEDFGGWVKAQASLTFIWVELANTFSMLACTPVAYAYVEDTAHAVVYSMPRLGVNIDWGMKKAVRVGMVVQVVVVAALWTPAVWVLRSTGRCEPMAWYGNVLGGVVALLICVRFFPQLRESYENKGAGSLSYVTYAMDICAGGVALVQKLIVTKERASTWLPPLVLHSMQACVLGMNYLHDREKLVADRGERRMEQEDSSSNAGERGYGSEDERVASERLLPRGGARSVGAPSSPRTELERDDERTTKLSWTRLLDVFL
jgi:uncharacterized protein with PQ loop repeat